MPKTKKDDTSDSDSGPDDRNEPVAKKAKEADNGKSGGGDRGGSSATHWTLEKMRQVRISEFRGRKMVDIREYYEKNGELLPTKKGICLSPLQWKKLLEYAAEITKALES